MGGHVFVSYSREDADYVERLVGHLREHDIDVRLDNQIATGTEWEQWIRDRIAASSALIVVMTPAAEASVHVGDEWTLARDRGTPVKPLLLAGEPFFGLRRLQYEDVRGERMPSAAFVEALGTVDGDPARPDERPGSGPPVPSGVLVASMGRARRNLIQDPFGSPAKKRVAWSADGRLLVASAGMDNSGVWVAQTGERIEPHLSPPHSLTWLDADDHFVIGYTNLVEVCQAGRLVRQTLRAGNPDPRGYVDAVISMTRDMVSGHVSALAAAPDGQRLAVATTKGKIEIWDRDGGVRTILERHRGKVHAVAWTRDGKRLATVGADHALRIWDPLDGAVQVRQDTAAIRLVDWSPDGRIATGHDDQRLVVRGPDGEVLRELTGHSGPVSSLAWAPDGAHLASTSDDGIAIWHAGSGKRLLTLTVPRGTQRSASWAPDGRLASVGDDNVIHVWEIWR